MPNRHPGYQPERQEESLKPRTDRLVASPEFSSKVRGWIGIAADRQRVVQSDRAQVLPFLLLLSYVPAGLAALLMPPCCAVAVLPVAVLKLMDPAQALAPASCRNHPTRAYPPGVARGGDGWYTLCEQPWVLQLWSTA